MKIGVLVNPIAGIGGAVALKGSDGLSIQNKAFSLGATKQASIKTTIVFERLLDICGSIDFYTIGNEMGSELLSELGINHKVVYEYDNEMSSAIDTIIGAKLLLDNNIDLLVFAGGDGTARDVCSAVGQEVPVIGIPAGVKIHSAVFAISLSAASRAIRQCVTLEKFDVEPKEVMDIDENSFRIGILKARKFGDMLIPRIRNLMQQPKASSIYRDEDLQGISWEITDRINKYPKDTCYIWGTGGTIFQTMHLLGFDPSLLGVDVTTSTKMLVKDGTEKEILDAIADRQAVLILSVIGGQGHILGRGSHQISPEVVRQIDMDDIWIVATMGKIVGLEKRVLHVDSVDMSINAMLSGYRRVIVGWRKELLCKVAD